MKGFITEDFLLHTEMSKHLFHHTAKNLPIIDYHNHLSPKAIADNYQFRSITEAWLEGDHYKWRAMRTAGVAENFITGGASDPEKFKKWVATVPLTMRNPLYHWSHLELQRYFDIHKLITPQQEQHIYEETSDLLKQPDYGAYGLLKKMNVEVVCTTDDPIHSLEHHRFFKDRGEPLKLLPTFRPDKVYNFATTEEFNIYLYKLESITDREIRTFQDLLDALKERVEYFNQVGCRLADHGLERLVYPKKNTFQIQHIFENLKNNKRLNQEERHYFTFRVLEFLCKRYHEKQWVQQFHLGAIRNNNKRLLSKLGADTGFDSIGDFTQVENLNRFLDHLDQNNQLAKTIIYNLNPADNEAFAATIGNFNDGTVKGKVQYGAAWWFLDQKTGIERHIDALSHMSLLSCFIGMLTDSRSFLSFPRHEYFRRILCDIIGRDVQNGYLPDDEQSLSGLIKAVCYDNAKAYFNF